MSHAIAKLLIAVVVGTIHIDICDGLTLKVVQAPLAPNVTETISFSLSNRHRPQIWPSDGGEPSNNLCIKNRIAPEFILLGTEMAGTASFAYMMRSPWLVSAKTSKNESNVHSTSMHLFDNEERFKQGKDFWLSHFPACDKKRRLVAIDATPSYMRTEKAGLVAQRISNFYSKKAAQIKFGVVLRDPLARAHSVFHQVASAGPMYDNGTDGGFRDYVEKFIITSRDPANDPLGLVKGGNYTAQLSAYFEVFKKTQFFVIPFKDLTKPEKKSDAGRFILRVWDSLGFAVTDETNPPPIVHLNENSHPALEDELEAADCEKARQVIARTIHAQKLAGLLTGGVMLPTYTRQTRSFYILHQWLLDRW